MHKFSTAAPPPSSERSEEITRRAAPPALHSVGLLSASLHIYETRHFRTQEYVCGGLAGYPLAGRAPVGAAPAGFSLRARGLKPTALFSGAFAAS